MIISHEYALEKASQASISGNYTEGICFSLLAMALSDGLRNNPHLAALGQEGTESAIASMAADFFTNPADPELFNRLQIAVSEWKATHKSQS